MTAASITSSARTRVRERLVRTRHEKPADGVRVTRCRSLRIIGAPNTRNIATGVQSSTNIYSITAGLCLSKRLAAAGVATARVTGGPGSPGPTHVAVVSTGASCTKTSPSPTYIVLSTRTVSSASTASASDFYVRSLRVVCDFRNRIPCGTASRSPAKMPHPERTRSTGSQRRSES
jgi:hypothetical protein